MSISVINSSSRQIRIVIVAAISLSLLWGAAGILPPAHAGGTTCGNGFYCTPAQTPEIIDSTGTHVGIIGTSYQFAHEAPNTDSDPLFYVGVEAAARAGDTNVMYGVSNLHVQVTMFDPNGHAVSGNYITIDKTLLSPYSDSSTAQAVLVFIYNALTRAVPYGIGSDIQDAIAPTLGGVSSGGPPNNNYVWGDWSTCIWNSCFGDHYHGLTLSFDMRRGDALPGTYEFFIFYHAEITECFNYNGNCQSGKAVVTKDLYDHVLDCYIKCNGSDASLQSQSPSSSQSATATLSQTTYLDSQFPTQTCGTCTSIDVKTYYGQLQYSLLGFSLPSLPANSFIQTATLQFNVNTVGPYPFQIYGLCNAPLQQGCQLSVSQITSSWSSSSVTWNNPPTTGVTKEYNFFPGLGTMSLDVTSLIQSAYSSGGFYGLQLSPYDTTELWWLGIDSASGSSPPSLIIQYITYTAPPSTMCTGASVPVSITMSNGGQSNWLATADGFSNPSKLESQNPEGNNNWGVSTIELAQSVWWYQSYTFSINAVAPLVPGTYHFQWRMLQQGVGTFGDFTPDVIVNVVPCGDFSISASSITVTTGQTGTSTATLSGLNGFAGQISLSDVVPTGLSCNPISPGSVIIPPSPVTATMSCSSNTAGSYTVTVTGTIGSLTHSATYTATVIAPDFTITANPTQVPADSKTTSTITIQANTNTPGISFTLSTTLGTFSTGTSTTTCTTGSSGSCTVTITSSQAGQATITATASSYPTHQTTIAFIGALNATSNTSSVPATITIQTSNNQGNVVISFTTTFGTLSATTCTTGSAGTCSVTLTSTSRGSATVTATAPYYTSASTSMTIDPNMAQFLSWTPPPATMTPGQQVTVSVTMKNVGSSTWQPASSGASYPYRLGSQNPQDNTRWGLDRVDLASPVPPGGQYTFTFVVTAPSTAGTYNFQWRMVEELIEWFGDYTPNYVVSVPGFTISASPNSLLLNQGGGSTDSITLTSINGYSGTVSLSASAPSGISVSFSPTSVSLPSGTSSGAWITVANSMAQGTYNIIITGTDTHSPPWTASTTIPLTVQDFTLSASPNYFSTSPGSSTSSTITVASVNGFCPTVSLSTTTPGGISVSLGATSIHTCGSASTTATITTSSTLPPGTYSITITGTTTNTSPSTTQTTGITVSIPCGCGGGGGGGSVAYGSLVTLANGSRIPVQDLKVGDVLLGYDPTTGQFTTSTVLSIATVQTTNMMIIHTQSGVPFRVDANPRQTLWVKTPDGKTEWMSVTQIQPGDDLLTPTGWTMVTSIEFAPAGNHTMFDITATMPYFTDNYLDPIRKM